jgi:hypothetical protein
MKNHVLVDLETIGTGHNAGIISIGAVRFDNNGMYDTFYTNIDVLDCIAKGAKADQRTMDWWKGQDEVLQKMMMVDPQPLVTALSKFTNFFNSVSSSYIWGFGPSFDWKIVINYVD